MEDRKMKKILTAIAALAMVAGLVSCNKENTSVNGSAENGFKKVTVTASVPEATKVTYSETDNVLTPAWEENDKILVINNDDTASELTVTEINGGVATLEGEAKEGAAHLIYKKGAATTDWVSNKIEVSYDGQSGDNDMPAVMLADGTISNGSGNFTFSNAGAVIGIYNAKGVPASSAIAKVTVTGSNLSKATISINGNALKLTATEKADDAISTTTLSGITADATEARALNTPIFIAVPAGAKVAKFTLTVGTDTYTYTLAAAKDCKANDYLYIKTREFKKDSNLPAGALAGVFTVSEDGKKVHFSQGNLWYGKLEGAQTATFNFEANQYEFHGYDSANNTWGLFGWVGASSTAFASSPEIYGVSTSDTNEDYGNTAEEALKADWGTAIDDKGTWRTLSKDEWVYLFNTRTVNDDTGEGKSYQRATINSDATGVYGMILYPDNYAETAKASYTSTEWTSLEAAGCVFLPAAGGRSGSDVWYDGEWGNYWSSTAYDEVDKAYNVCFNSGSVATDSHDDRSFGYSVRLITESK